MKHLLINSVFIIALLFSINVNAQNNKSPQEKPTINKINTPLVIKATRPIFNDDFGQTFNSSEISRMPFRNINSIANTVAGVNSYGGGIPSIKGAPASGTAYFVDGVRVYGAIPNFR